MQKNGLVTEFHQRLGNGKGQWTKSRTKPSHEYQGFHFPRARPRPFVLDWLRSQSSPLGIRFGRKLIRGWYATSWCNGMRQSTCPRCFFKLAIIFSDGRGCAEFRSKSPAGCISELGSGRDPPRLCSWPVIRGWPPSIAPVKTPDSLAPVVNLCQTLRVLPHKVRAAAL